MFSEGQELVLSTCSKNAEPNANIVISLGFVDDKLLIADAQMDTTIKNLQNTKRVCIVAKKDEKYYRIKGNVEIYPSGKYLDLCSQKDKQHQTKNAILVTIKEVFDLDNIKKIL